MTAPWFYVGFPALMITMPGAAVVFWCLLTGVRGCLPVLLATLLVLVSFGVSAYTLGPSVAAHPLHTQLWGMGGFLVLLLGLALPFIRKAFGRLPEPPRGASLRTRRLELFRGAFVWPYVAWAALTASLLFVDRPPILWIGPGFGLVFLLILRPCLTFSMREPEPLGGPDPAAVEERWAAFRRRRVRVMYWLTVTISLLATSGWLIALGEHRATWVGAILGPLIGVFGGFFGVWADAQRYLLRRQLTGGEPL